MVYDSISQEVLPFANVMLVNNQKGNATNIEGICTIDLGKNTRTKDTLVCSFIGFTTRKIIIQLPLADTLKINLSSNSKYLKEVLVSKKDERLSGRELVNNAIKNVKENYPVETVELETFYREKLFENNKFIELNESINSIVYTKYPQKGYAKKSFRQYWNSKQEWQKEEGFPLWVGLPQFFKYYNTVDDKCYVKTKRVSNNLSESDPKTYSYITGGPLALTAIDKVKYLADFMDPKLLGKYDYYRKNAVLIDGVLCIEVGFKPKVGTKPVHQPWNKKIGFPLYSGTICISKDDFAVVKFECQFSIINKTLGYQVQEPWQIYPTTISVQVKYNQLENGKWILNRVRTNQFIKANPKGKWKVLEDYNCIRELTVFNVQSDLGKARSNDKLLRDIESARLRSFTSEYDALIWEEFDKENTYKLSKKELEEIGKNKKNVWKE